MDRKAEEMLSLYIKKLEANPSYSYGTRSNYRKAIQSLLNQYGHSPTIEQMNKFITDKCQKRQFYAKYAIKDYLFLLFREGDYLKLVPARAKHPERQKVFLDKDELMEIIRGIDNQKFRDMALLQYACAARIMEIITLEAKKIKKEQYKEGGESRERIRAVLRGKGDKPRAVFFRMDMAPLFERNYDKKRRFLFLGEEANKANDQGLYRMGHALYLRYLAALKASAKKSNRNLRTHDIRRSVSSMAHLYDDRRTRLPQHLLGHDNPAVTERYLQDETEKVSEFLLQHQKDILS